MLRLLLLAVCCTSALHAADADRDGIDDELEQKLLGQFLPSFIISGGECDVAPAEFSAGLPDPQVVARNGTIYAQVRRYDAERLELHYYHLWARDCGPASHTLDTEHVSALVRTGSSEPRAELWYAAAHEDTLCSSGAAVRANFLASETHGPPVWISRGKHGSFFASALCRRGCGGDRCEVGQPLAVHQVVNLGELDAPMNGALWAASPRWPLRAKMGTDFSPELVARMAGADGVVELRGMLMPAQVAIAGSGRAVTEVGGAERRTEDALSTAQGDVGKALSGAHRSVKKWIRRRF
jgi:hypothetical protein